MRSNRARSTFRILPFSGRMAWDLRSRPCLADPPAESPSTMNTSALAGSRSWQSASLPGRVDTSSTPLRRVSSRALRAASRALAASITFCTIDFASRGWVSNQWLTTSATTACTTGCTSELTSLSLVWLLNFGSGTLTDSTQVMPSRMSSPTSASSFLPMPSAYLVTTRVNAWRYPARWLPPSRCGDVVGVAEHRLVEAVVPGQGELDTDATRAIDTACQRLAQDGGLRSIQEAHELDQAAIETEIGRLHRGVPLVEQADAQARVQERQLPQALLQDRVFEFRLGEGGGTRFETSLPCRSPPHWDQPCSAAPRHRRL